MPTFQYRAITPAGEFVAGQIAAADAAEAVRRVEGLGLVPVAAPEAPRAAANASWFGAPKPKPEDVTIFTADLALLLRTGVRIDEALALLAAETDVGRMRPVVADVASGVVAGESFADAIGRRPDVFPPLYVALIRAGETSGALPSILETLAAERRRAEAARRKIEDALRYPAFLLFAAGAVLIFFLGFVLPQFAGVFRDFNAKLDPMLVFFLGLSDFLRSNAQGLAATALAVVAAVWFVSRRPEARARALALAGRAPWVGRALEDYRTTLFCRNLSVLLGNGVTLPESLKILAGVMASTDAFTRWSNIVDIVRRGGKLSEALTDSKALPPMAVKTLRLGEETGQLPSLAGRVADFYEAKLQRGLDRVVGVVGPLAIILISVIVGGLIVSVMTALLSVNQMAS